ncbi:ral guanine nucleotide dissociation stimulator-like 3 isoform X3 [Suricata suricatta]|uniref:ral guanine nucleotide dissociation stimulator-like 3 isoform X3 n=1 Tax=Suricata suricatta TaxID=37032 RepID=UPI001155B907|nr:ral guanine nucleotide dissociation stimulator-like 3 isoform X3 [Suricata suricatta]
MDRTAGKDLALAPLQDWGEETEEGAVYSVSLRRQLSRRSSPREGPGGSQAPSPAADAFLHYRTSKVRTLRAARLECLVRELVSGDREQDPGFVPAFLATHRAFVSTARVLGLLLPPPPPPLPPGIEIKKTEGGLPVNKNLRAVVSVLGSWLRDHPQDFRAPPAHSDLGSVRTFLGWAAPAGPEAREAEKLLGDFLEEAERKQEEEQSEARTGPAGAAQTPRPDLPEGCWEEEEGLAQEGPELLDFSVDEVAEQLTLMDAGLAAPQRAQRLEKWICIAQRCRELRNFSSLRAILSALQSNPIYRLKRSWGAVSRERLSTFRKLSQIFSDENNHLSSREILSQEEATEGPQEEDTLPGSLSPNLPPGPVPYLGTFLTDLVMLDTALPDMLEGELINFEKRRKEWEILAHIQQLQKRCRNYRLSPHAPILAALRAQRQLSEEQSYHVSRVIEPPAASCPSSPRIRRRLSLTKRLSAKLSRERGSPPGGSPGDPSSPTSSLSPGSPPSSPRTREPPPGSPPASPGPQGPSTKLPLSPDLAGSRPLALPLRSSHISLPGQQGSEARVIHVSIDNDHGNLYRSILLTSQDKAPTVVQRALQKHNVAQPWARDYQLFQVLPGDRELLIPDNANVFYAMSPAAPGDFVLRRKDGAQHTTTISST